MNLLSAQTGVASVTRAATRAAAELATGRAISPYTWGGAAVAITGAMEVATAAVNLATRNLVEAVAVEAAAGAVQVGQEGRWLDLGGPDPRHIIAKVW